MDWSPRPKRWEGRNTMWPHNPQTGWSYCVMIPAWSLQPDPSVPHENLSKSVVFYRIHVGVQSPEGVSSSHGILRRFSDFLKLYSDLKQTFPKKDVPPPPPKHPFSRINSSRSLLEERRHALEEWVDKLLSDIDLSRSAPVASFLELEVAARSAFQDWNQLPSETSSSENVVSWGGVHQQGHDSDASFGDSSVKDVELARGSDSPRTISNGVFGGQTLQHTDEYHVILERHASEDSDGRNDSKSFYDADHDLNVPRHARKNSAESIGSDLSSIKGSEVSIPGMTASMWDGSSDIPFGAKTPLLTERNADLESQFFNDADMHIVFPADQGQKFTRLLVTMQRRIMTAKTDMEDLIARLNQETAVKEYLSTKVKDLEVELEVTKQKGRETLQQAILVERERFTQMQWDMDELRRKCSEMESNLMLHQSDKNRVESEKTTASREKENLLKELEAKSEELKNVQNHLQEVESKSKADIKVLAKEVKFLRNSQAEMKKVLNRYMEENTELQRVVHEEKQRTTRTYLARKKLLHECRLLRQRLQECNVKLFAEEQDMSHIDSSKLPDALQILATSDNRIGLLLAEAQLLQEDDVHVSDNDDNSSNESSDSSTAVADDEFRRMLADLLIDNAQLLKHKNSVMRDAMTLAAAAKAKPENEPTNDTVRLRKSMLGQFLDR